MTQDIVKCLWPAMGHVATTCATAIPGTSQIQNIRMIIQSEIETMYQPVLGTIQSTIAFQINKDINHVFCIVFNLITKPTPLCEWNIILLADKTFQ